MAQFQSISVGTDWVTYEELSSFNSNRATYEAWQLEVKSHVEAGSKDYGFFAKVLPYEVVEVSESLGLPASLIEIGETLFEGCDDITLVCRVWKPSPTNGRGALAEGGKTTQGL